MRERLRNYRLLLRWLPLLLTDGETRRLLREMMGFVRGIPEVMRQPLPKAIAAVTAQEPSPPGHLSQRREGEQKLRELADLAAVLERRSVPGICLKRSLVRYHYLTQIGVPLEIVFGARFVEGVKKDVTGHAWLEQDGEVYWESAENVTPFTPIYRYSSKTTSSAIG